MKQRIYLFLFLLINVLQGYAQKVKEIEPGILECQYAHEMLLDTLDAKSIREDLMILRIGKNVSEFFSRYMFYGDSLFNDPKGKAIAIKLTMTAIRTKNFSNKPGIRTTSEYIYKNYPEGKNSIYGTDNSGALYMVTESKPNFKWAIIDSTKIICGYTCQLATTYFRGRNYEAWFTTEIPVSDGPWKLAGLPGLILEAYDTENHYHYTCIGITHTDVSPVCYYNYWEHKYEKIERKKYLKACYKSMTTSNSMRTFKARSGIDLGQSSHPGQPLKFARDFLEKDYH
jgi:GLPGLI family protein